MVPRWLRETAQKAVADAALDLGIREPTIRWWNADPGHSRAGWTEDGIRDEVNLVANRMRDVYSSRARVFHECRHIDQDIRARYLGDRKAREDDANRWARAACGYSPDLLEHWES